MHGFSALNFGILVDNTEGKIIRNKTRKQNFAAKVVMVLLLIGLLSFLDRTTYLYPFLVEFGG